MEYRELGRTGMKVSAISFGAWPIGGGWGEVSDAESIAALDAAIDAGTNFIDTADVYGDGRSERLIRGMLAGRKEHAWVATKAGRRLDPHVAEGYNYGALRSFAERSRENLGTETIDLLQLHCPPTVVYSQSVAFEALERMTTEGVIRHYGVSVETVDEAIKALDYPGVKTIQIIFNIFRQRPAELFFREAKSRWIGILARVPLASGMLTGKMSRTTRFKADDHRQFNRKGQAFDRGETFSGVDYLKGLQAVDELKQILPNGMTLAQFALKWILMHDAVSCVIPGGKNPAQVQDNCGAATAPRLSRGVMRQVKEIYDKYARDDVHHRW